VTSDTLFQIVNTATLVAWLPLVFLPRRRWATTIVPIAMPALLAVVYLALLIASLPGSNGSYSSLAGVRALFADPRGLLAGWTHYLAFDLLVGNWEMRDARTRGIPYVLVLPCLVLTFLFGPAGWLLYGIVRSSRGAEPIAQFGLAFRPTRM